MPEATRTSDQAASALRDFHPQLRTEVAPPSSEDYNCPICLDLLLEPVVGACGHEFCKDCYTSWLSRSGGYPNCPLCRKSLAYTVPGVSRRLAELIEAIFPEKTKLRRQMKDQERAAETVHALPPGLAGHRYPHAVAAEAYPAAAAAEPVRHVVRHIRQFAAYPPDLPFPDPLQPVPQELRRIETLPIPDVVLNPSADAPGSPMSAYEPSDPPTSPALSPPGHYGSNSDSPIHSPLSPAYDYQSPRYRPTSPSYGQQSPPYRSTSPSANPRSPHYHPSYPLPNYSVHSPSYSPTSPAYGPLSPQLPQYSALSPGATATSSADRPQPSAYSPILPAHSPASPPYRPASPEYDPTESGRLPYSSPAYSPYRYPSTSPPHPFASPSDSYTASPRNAALSPAHSPGAAATRPGSAGRASPAAQTEPTGRQAAGSGFAALPHTFPAADERLPAYRDFSRLLQSTDQLAQQLQGASERLSYLSDYAGRSFGRYAGSATFPGAFWAAQRAQLQSPHAVEPYAAYIASRGGAPAAPWAAYGHYPAPSFTAYPPAPSYGPYTAAGPAGSSFAQSMPPPGTLPFTMGSEPREPARGSRRAQVAATAMNPARYRIGRGQRRS